jgi:hypothetical protein
MAEKRERDDAAPSSVQQSLGTADWVGFDLDLTFVRYRLPGALTHPSTLVPRIGTLNPTCKDNLPPSQHMSSIFLFLDHYYRLLAPCH